MRIEEIKFTTLDGRRVTLTEPVDNVLELLIEGQVIARFTPGGVNVHNILKEVKTSGRES